jgi:hypothetical protein
LDNQNCFENEFGIDIETARKTEKMYRIPLVSLMMATRYVQDVSKQTDAVIGKTRSYVV